MSDIALIHCTFADREEALRVAQAVVSEGLAACANVMVACTSVYRWQGVVEQADETPVLFKTGMALAEPLRARIAALHSYDLPVIETWPAAVSPEAAAWIAAETG